MSTAVVQTAPGAALGTRALALLLVIPALVLLDGGQLQTLYIVAGQGHFAATYYYQAKAGRIGRLYVAAYLVAAPLLYLLFFRDPFIPVLVLVVVCYFIVHFSQDERFLFGRAPTLRAWLDFLPLVLMYAGFILTMAHGHIPACGPRTCMVVNHPQFPLPQPLFVASGLVLLANLALSLRRSRRLDPSSLYFHGGSVALLALYASEAPVTLAHLLAVPILLHYVDFYAHYYVKPGPGAVRRRYVTTIALINLGVVGLAVLTVALPAFRLTLGAALFSPLAFYFWTLVHMLFTTRRADVAVWIPALRSR